MEQLGADVDVDRASGAVRTLIRIDPPHLQHHRLDRGEPAGDPLVSAGGQEAGRRHGHVQGLVRSVVVVLVAPRIELLLGVGLAGVHPARQELLAQRVMPPLDLARRRRGPGLGQQVVDMPFSRQIRSNSTSPLPFPNRPVNTFR